MAYTKTTDFAVKDTLLTGNPAKTVKGTEIDDEFNAIETADGLNLKGATTSTDNAIVRFDSTTGKAAQNSVVTLSDTGVVAGASIDLGANTVTGTTTQFNTALSDGDFATVAGTEVLTNKTLTTPVLSNPSFSGTTSNMGTVTTIDINGGTIDGTVIGGASAAAITGTTITASTSFAGALNGTVGATTPNAGSFTTLSATGNVTLGNASTDTVTVSGYIDGRLFVKTPTSRTNIASTASYLQIEDTSSSASPAFVRNSNDVNAPFIVLGKSRAVAVGGVTTVTSADQTGGVSFNGTDGTSLVESSRIQCFVDNTVSTGVVPGRMLFYTSSAAGAITERMRIDSSGQVGIGLTPTARNNSRLQIVDGIGFPTTQVASSDANTLDDYEEGTFTPTVRDGVGGNAATATTSSGRYTKIGKRVFYDIVLVNIDTTGLTAGNQIVISGLPLTSETAAGLFSVVHISKDSVTTTTGSVSGFIGSNTTSMTLVNELTTAVSPLPVSAITSGSGDLYISGSYIASA